MVYLFAEISQLQAERAKHELSTVDGFLELCSYYDTDGVLQDVLPHIV